MEMTAIFHRIKFIDTCVSNSLVVCVFGIYLILCAAMERAVAGTPSIFGMLNEIAGFGSAEADNPHRSPIVSPNQTHEMQI